MQNKRSVGLYEDNLITGEAGFNLVAILLFGRNEVMAVPGYVTDCLLRIDNVDCDDDRLPVEMCLIESFDILMEFIAKHTLDRFYLIDNLNVSVRSHIAKEVVSNILYHIIARFFVNIGFADTLGSGVRNIYKYMRIYSALNRSLLRATSSRPSTRS